MAWPGGWLESFMAVFELCRIGREEQVAILHETATRPDLLALSRAALAGLGHAPREVAVPTPAPPPGPILRSTGASRALEGQQAAVAALCAADFVVDLTVEGLMHARQTGRILKSGTRILNISHEHPDALARLGPDPALKDRVKEAVARIRSARQMRVTSPAGSDLVVGMEGASTVGVWGWTDRPGTLAHWPGGIVVSFPAAGATNGRLVFAPGDVNLTFKRYFETPVTAVFEDDYITALEGDGLDAVLMRRYLADFPEREAWAVSHVGWGLNPAARYEALTMYDRADTNGTELRAVAGNFLFSTGANEFAGRFTAGHFDLPMMGCTIALDGVTVVEDGRCL